MTEDSAKAPRKRSRSSYRKGNSSNVNAGRKNSQPRGRKAAPKVDPVEFWGDPETLRIADEAVEHSGDARALIESLGRPPVPGQETAAQRWFTLVYERAAFLAGALAVAGELDGSE
ncbi:MAG: hypothetical protein OXB92_07005 [Acidimicrobiaceae bacterium]|nr:hypothetical protein [Acidimicrobiia bacterium]MCY4493584.1 hypothetical protein [Acidimicrobiaceae bacterium]